MSKMFMKDIYIKLSNRLNFIRAYLSPTRDFPCPIREVLQGFTRVPCTRRGPQFIESIAKEDNFFLVKISSCPTVLYWPCFLPLYNLYMVVTECFYQHDWHFYEVPETSVLQGDIVFDCGTAEGIFSLRVLERARQIVAFEPDQVFIESLNLTFVNQEHVHIVPIALGSKEGQIFFKSNSLQSAITNNEQDTPIQMTTIDAYTERTGTRVDFIKGDLESFEMEVLKGAARSIKEYKPKIAMTTYHLGNDWKDMLSFVRTLVPEYQYRIKGLSYNGQVARPIMIHLWVENRNIDY